MIYDHIENRSKYSDLLGIAKALDYLAGLKPDNTPTEKTYLDGDELIVNPLTYATKPRKECVFEVHRTYADIHYMLTGEETISIASTEGLHETKAHYLPTRKKQHLLPEHRKCVLLAEKHE